MLDHPERRIDAIKAVLDLFAIITGKPIGLFEKKDGEWVDIFSTASLDNFEPHCKLIQAIPEGKLECDKDQCLRAEQVSETRTPALTCCHAGLWNQAVPILVDNQVRAVFSFGEMLLHDGTHMQKTMQRHKETVQRFDLSHDQAEELYEALLAVNQYTPEEVQKLMDKLVPIQTYLYNTIERERDVQHNLEKVVHELQTRLQSIIADSENIMMEASTLKPTEIRKMSNDLLSSAEAMAVVVNNLGDFQRSYHFQEEKIRPLFIEAWRIYKAEAEERYIRFKIKLNQINKAEPSLEISRQHLELAINNLMHNAIKYSYSGSMNRERRVEVEGSQNGAYYQLIIRNYGIGILPEEIEKGLIFTDGYQGQLTHGENRTGSGKGLTFVKRVIDRHHGTIHVESVPMGNREDVSGQPYLNTFTIELPISQEKEKG